MPEMDGLELLGPSRIERWRSTVIMMSAYGSLDTAVEAMKRGAYDYISKPFKPMRFCWPCAKPKNGRP